MSKLKKMLIIVSFFIMTIFLYFSVSLAVNIDLGKGHASKGKDFDKYYNSGFLVTKMNSQDKIRLHKYLYRRYGQLLCTEAEQHTLWDYHTYTVVRVRLSGKKATYLNSSGNEARSTGNLTQNLIFKNILTQGYDSDHPNAPTSEDSLVNTNDPIQLAVWKYFKTWYDAVRPTLFTTSKLDPKDSNKYYQDGAFGQATVDKAKDYANNYSTAVKIDRGEVSDKMTFGQWNKTTTCNGWTAVGMFKLEYSGKINSIELVNISNQTVSESDYRIGYYADGGWKVASISTIRNTSGIINGKRVYLIVRSGITPKNITFKKTASDTDIEIAFLYSDDTNSQNMFFYQKVPITREDSVTISFTDLLGELEILKVKERNGVQTSMSGVKFQITGPNGYNETLTTTSAGRISISNLIPGTYRAKEIEITNDGEGETNYGYVVSNTSNTAKVTSGKKTTMEKFVNKYQIGELVIYKRKEKNETISNFAGVKFRVTGPNGYNQVVTTNETTGRVRLQVFAGKYTVQEIEIPNNGKGEENYGFEVDSTSQVITVTAENESWATFTNKYQLGQLEINKVKKKDGQTTPFQGVTFRVTGPSNYNKTFITDENGQITITELEPGEYKVQEISIVNSGKGQANYGYEIGDNEETVTVTADKTTTTSKFVNEYKLGTLKVHKDGKKGSTTVNLEGVEFTLYQNNVAIGTYTTDANGDITINDLWEGTYTITETKINDDSAGQPNYGFVVEPQNTSVVQIKPEQTETRTFSNRYRLGTLVINKKGDIGGEQQVDLAGVQFTLYQDGKTIGTYTTNANGQISIGSLWEGNYTIRETGITNSSKGQSNYGYIVENHSANITITGGYTTTVPTFVNTYRLGSMVLTKKDLATNLDMANVGFTIRMTSGERNGQYVGVDGSGWATYSTSPQTVRTNNQGQITITHMWEGTFELVETVNPYPGYDQLPKSMGTGTILGKNQQITVNKTNEKKYINLTGTVWEEVVTDQGKNTVANNLMDSYENKVSGIRVRLLKNGVVQDTKITDSNGYYIFEDVLIADIKNNSLSIEYQYNGMKYKSIPVNTSNTLGSKASDLTASRNLIDNTFNTITANSGIEYQHNSNTYTSSVTYRSQYAGYSNNYFAQNKYHVEANTAGIYNFSAGYNAYNLWQSEIVVNYGITEKEQPNLSTVKDVQSVRVNIAGLEYVYNYADRFTNTIRFGNGHEIEPQVKFATGTYSNMSYTRPLYASDIMSNITVTNENPVEVRVTYRIQLKNKATTIDTKVNEIIDFYDNRFELEGVGSQINSTGRITSQLPYSNSQSSGNYNSIRINTSSLGVIRNQSTKDIYIVLRVKYEDLQSIVNNNTPISLENVAEITSYTSYYDEDGKKPYGGIDHNSQPGNTIPGDKTTFEDDTDRAPGLALTLQNPRETTGNVFEDITPDELNSGQIREADGQYTAEDKAIQNVTVRLLKVNDDNSTSIANVWNNNQWVPAQTTTTSSGSYKIEGYIPGHYIVEYEWGDNTYRVQDYKSTVVDRNSYQAKQSNLEWYKDEFKDNYPGVEWNQYTNTEIRVSDAVDDYTTREAIDAQMTEITYGVQEKLNKTYDESYTGEKYINKISAYTPEFSVGIEYDSVDPTIPNKIENIDFGIVKRAIQTLELIKRIDTVKLTLANGNVLIDAHVVERNGQLELENAQRYATYIPQSSNNLSSGQFRIEIDTEIIQGATLEIKYAYYVQNISEVEYLSEDFYNYGSQVISLQNPNNVVQLRALEVMDYIDNNVAISLINEQEASGNGWKKVDNNKKNELLANNSSDLPKIYEKFDVVYKEVNNILTTNKLENISLKPEDITQINLTTYRVLAQSQEGLHVENDAEIIRISKTGGSSITTVPGNYNPTETPRVDEPDSDESEDVTIIPPTGLTTDYTTYAVLAVCSLGIVILGVVLIKKYVLK